MRNSRSDESSDHGAPAAGIIAVALLQVKPIEEPERKQQGYNDDRKPFQGNDEREGGFQEMAYAKEDLVHREVA